ncbi:MAG TPA: hypothetical protein VFS20_26595 [Longimicrobium sp.]|nr:hypothetical protein [Longimicrobium sp.]
MKKTWFAAVPAILALGACSVIGPGDCPTIISYSVEVTAVDSITNVNVTPGATLVLANSAGVDSFTVETGPLTVAGVGIDRTGTFTLRVRQGGYQLWEKTGIRVERGECGARTVNVTARLQPFGPVAQ